MYLHALPENPRQREKKNHFTPFPPEIVNQPIESSLSSSTLISQYTYSRFLAIFQLHNTLKVQQIT